MEAPDPTVDWEGYLLWCEMHPCPSCDGSGEVDRTDDCRETCRTCEGSGLDPEFAVDMHDDDCDCERCDERNGLVEYYDQE